MYGVEAAIILLVCVSSLVALWTAPVWMRGLARFFARLNRRLDRSGAAIERFLGVNDGTSPRDLQETNREPRDIFPKEEL